MPAGKKMTDDQTKTIEMLYAEYSDTRIAAVIGVAAKTVRRYRRENNLYRQGEEAVNVKRSGDDIKSVSMHGLLSSHWGGR